MTKIISLFNNKGGVSKTTTTFHLGWALAEKGHKVLMVDTDSQCNLTGLCLDLSGIEDIESFYTRSGIDNIKTALESVFDGMPKELTAAKCFEIPSRDGLFLLPGHIGFSEYDVSIGISQELTGSLKLTQNIPGAINHLIQLTAKKYAIDYVLIDMSPSVTATNANILMQSNFFLVPCSPDYFCNMAINSLSRVLPDWKDTYDRIKSNPVFKDAHYKFPTTTPKFIGTIMQRYRPKNGSPAKSFQSWIEKIDGNVAENLIPRLAEIGMVISSENFRVLPNQNEKSYNISNISDFNSLIAQSQKYNVPVFSLTSEQIEQSGNVLNTSEKNRDDFHEVFKLLADNVIELTS